MNFPFNPFSFLYKAKEQDKQLDTPEAVPVNISMSEAQRMDRLLRIFSSDEGDALLHTVAQKIDDMVKTASLPNVANNSHNAAHALGGVYALRELFNELQGLARAHELKVTKKKTS